MFQDTCGKILLLAWMGSRAECQACADVGVTDPINISDTSFLAAFIVLHNVHNSIKCKEFDYISLKNQVFENWDYFEFNMI